MESHLRARKAVMVFGLVTALLTGAIADPALAATVGLPTGIIQVGVVNYSGFENETRPSSRFPYGFGLTEVTEDNSNDGDAIDDALHLMLNGKPFRDADGSVDVSPDTDLGPSGQMLTASGRTAGLKVTAKIGMFSTAPNSERARVAYTIKNPSRTDSKKVTAFYSNNFGSDEHTVIERTTDGDPVLEAADSWMVLSDDGDGTDDDDDGDVVNVLAFGDTGNTYRYPEPTRLGNGDQIGDTLINVFTFRIKPRKTAQLLFFHQFEDVVAEAEVDANDFDTLVSAAAVGLTAGLSGRFVNWKSP